jgi:hypothetical protein
MISAARIESEIMSSRASSTSGFFGSDWSSFCAASAFAAMAVSG